MGGGGKPGGSGGKVGGGGGEGGVGGHGGVGDGGRRGGDGGGGAGGGGDGGPQNDGKSDRMLGVSGDTHRQEEFNKVLTAVPYGGRGRGGRGAWRMLRRTWAYAGTAQAGAGHEGKGFWGACGLEGGASGTGEE